MGVDIKSVFYLIYIMAKKICFWILTFFVLTPSFAFAQSYPPPPQAGSQQTTPLNQTGQNTSTTQFNTQAGPNGRPLAKPPLGFGGPGGEGQGSPSATTAEGGSFKTAMQQARAQFKTQIMQIRDERKRTIVGNIDDRVATANANLTNKMTQTLTRFTNILTMLTIQSTTFKGQGKDTTALDAAIASAQTAITTAQNAVTTQETKTYSANVTDESTLRTTIGGMVSGFRTDIMTVYQTMIDAKQKVANAWAEAEKLKGNNTATQSATPATFGTPSTTNSNVTTQQ